jgi:membrane-associated phospholipid phosphatase
MPRGVLRRTGAACAAAAVLAFAGGAARAGGGPLGIDVAVPYDDRALYDADLQRVAYRALVLVPWAGALLEGTDSRLGRTWWRSAESSAASLVAVAGVKALAQRKRPNQTDPPDPDLWRQGSRYESFPSGHVTLATAAVAPFIMEYGREQPAVWALAAIPVWMGFARVNVQAHWQTDVLGGWALGLATAWLATRPDSPLVLQAFGDGGFVGLRYRW